VNDQSPCEGIRLDFMASFDGEAPGTRPEPGAGIRLHTESCEACREWLHNLESMDRHLRALEYPAGSQQLWPEVGRRLQPYAARDGGREMRRLYVMAAAVLVWRSIELLGDVPFPAHSVIPLAAVAAALWLASDALAIQTVAPELQKRGAL
jgi:predicted anti-sigma-YlaC factor YlaD